MTMANGPANKEVCAECGEVHADPEALKQKLYKGIIDILHREKVPPLAHNKRAVAVLISEIGLELAFEAGQDTPPEEEEASSGPAPVLDSKALDDAPDLVEALLKLANDKLPKA